MERSSLNQNIQIGVEATPGTTVAASKRLRSIGIEPTVEAGIDQFRPMGQKYRALATLGKEWVSARINGRGTYTELVYMLSSAVNTAAITTPVGAILGRNWQFLSDTFADDVPKTFTVEHGSPVRADEFSYGLVTELGMSFDRSAVNVTGTMIGHQLTDGITMTAAPTTVALVPILPRQVSVYLDTTAAGIGVTKLTRAISTEFSIGSRFSPVWVLDAAEPAFVSHVESEPDVTVGLKVQANSVGMGLLNQLRSGDTMFLRIEAAGGVGSVEVGTDYTFTADFAVKIADTGGFSDEEGVQAFEWNFVAVHDETLGNAFDINMINALTAL